MVRLRPPSGPVGVRWTLTPPSVFLICFLLLFTIACSTDQFDPNSNQSNNRSFSSQRIFFNMDFVADRTLPRSRPDLTTEASVPSGEVDSAISRSVTRRKNSSVEFRKLNRLNKHSSKNNYKSKMKVGDNSIMNAEQGTLTRQENLGVFENVSNTLPRIAVPKNFGSEFNGVNLTAKSRLVSKHWVPKVMLDLYDAAQKPGHTSPYGADTIRSFTPLEPVSVLQHTIAGEGAEDNRLYEGRGGDALTPDTASYSFPFKLMLPKGEHVRNLLLRLHTIVGRKHSPAGLERRLRVFVTRHQLSASSGSTHRPRPLEVARKDVYLHNHSWLTLNVRPLLRLLGPPDHTINVTIVVQIERAFACVGDTGDLELDHTSGIDFQPLLLLYTSLPNLARKAKHQLQHFVRRSRRSAHENDWDWDGGDETEEEPEPQGRERGQRGGGRRAGRRRRAKNTCKRRPLKVAFDSIGWQDWVIAPLEYEAYQCSGKCFYPLASHLNPTKHAVIQTLMHSRSSERARRACCVPTLLGPISLLYLEKGVPTFKKEYDDMVALECGCR